MNPESDSKKVDEFDAFVHAKKGFDQNLPSLVQRTASQSRNNTRCAVSHFTSGVFNVVFRVIFDDNVVWVCRVHKNDKDVSPLCVKSKIDSTIATMRYIKLNLPSVPVPEIYASESDPETSALKAAYILMEALEGSEVGGNLSPEDECAVYKQLACVTWQLSGLCFPKIGKLYQSTSTNEFYVGPFVNKHGCEYGPFDTSVEYFIYEAAKIEAKQAPWRAMSEESNKTSMEVCQLYKRAASLLADHCSGSFPLVHGDFDKHNALFQRDTEGKLQLTGIVDWDSAIAGSWLQFCAFPNFLTIRWPTFERRRYSQFVLDRIKRRRDIFLQQLRKEESASQTPVPGRPSNLHSVFDSPAVRVADFINSYSDPYYEAGGEMLRKYLSAWKKDIDW